MRIIIKKIQIKIEFFNFLPELCKMNKGIFNEKYIKGFLEYSKKQLTLKSYNESKSVINALLVSLGSLSLFINPEIFKICLNELEAFLINLYSENRKNNKIFDVEVFKCLADLLNNKVNFYMEFVIRSINLQTEIFYILSEMNWYYEGDTDEETFHFWSDCQWAYANL